MNEDEKIRLVHPFELLRVVTYGTPEERDAAAREYDRRIAEGPDDADGLRTARTLYLAATAHAFTAMHGMVKWASDHIQALAPWFNPAPPAPKA